MNTEKMESRLEVYENRSELFQGDKVSIYREGPQNKDAQDRYEKINVALENGFLRDMMKSIVGTDFTDLSTENKKLIQNLVKGITSQVGRALVGVAFLQMTIKAICPEQSIRLHKGGARSGAFSWEDGISMRTIDSSYITPFLREYNLLNVNKYGVFMTRSLAENYPYSKLYKAEMRGPFDEWIEIVDALEYGSMPPELGLRYLAIQMKNRHDNFLKLADETVAKAKSYPNPTLPRVKSVLTYFFNNTDYRARAFEVVIHGLMQAMQECGLLDGRKVVPLSQMRSANKKHGNIGDVELVENRLVVESWDAKYGKPYLRDELEELRDKIPDDSSVEVAGFIVNSEVDKRSDVITRAEEIQQETGVEICLLSFDEWLERQTSMLNMEKRNCVAQKWLIAVVESFALKRPDLAPIDEPCDEWLKDLQDAMLKS